MHQTTNAVLQFFAGSKQICGKYENPFRDSNSHFKRRQSTNGPRRRLVVSCVRYIIAVVLLPAQQPAADGPVSVVALRPDWRADAAPVIAVPQLAQLSDGLVIGRAVVKWGIVQCFSDAVP